MVIFCWIPLAWRFCRRSTLCLIPLVGTQKWRLTTSAVIPTKKTFWRKNSRMPMTLMISKTNILKIAFYIPTKNQWRKLTLAVPRHSDGDCKGTVTDSYRSNFDWVWLGGTGSVQSIRAFRALVSPALMGAEHISRSFLWGRVYFSAGEVLRTVVEKLALLIYVSTTAIEVNISKGAPMLFE